MPHNTVKRSTKATVGSPLESGGIGKPVLGELTIKASTVSIEAMNDGASISFGVAGVVAKTKTDPDPNASKSAPKGETRLWWESQPAWL
ncbi:hypothetical protein MASR2M70_13670 [Bacillota bacterium]